MGTGLPRARPRLSAACAREPHSQTGTNARQSAECQQRHRACRIAHTAQHPTCLAQQIAQLHQTGLSLAFRESIARHEDAKPFWKPRAKRQMKTTCTKTTPASSPKPYQNPSGSIPHLDQTCQLSIGQAISPDPDTDRTDRTGWKTCRTEKCFEGAARASFRPR